MDALDTFLRAEIDALQYAGFFGTLVLFSGLELLASRSTGRPDRRSRWSLNYALTALNIVVLGAIPVTGVVVAGYAHARGYGLLNAMAIGPLAALVITVLLRSLLSFATHWAMHNVPLLWRIHRVHHTDPFLDVSTTVRFHPAEFLINTPILVAAVLALGLSPVALMIYELLDAIMAVITHSNVRLPARLDRALRTVLVTPDMHRLHHSAWQPETDSNYGATLSIWDRLFGTHRSRQAEQLGALELGLCGCSDERSKSLWWLLTLPFRPLDLTAPKAGACSSGRNLDGQLVDNSVSKP